MTFLRFPPPATTRVSTRLPNAGCSFCHGAERDDRFWTGRILNVQHKRRTICEACVEYADEMALCASLARRPVKARPGKRRLSTRRNPITCH